MVIILLLIIIMLLITVMPFLERDFYFALSECLIDRYKINNHGQCCMAYLLIISAGVTSLFCLTAMGNKGLPLPLAAVKTPLLSHAQLCKTVQIILWSMIVVLPGFCSNGGQVAFEW